MKQGKGTALEHSLRLFNQLKGVGVQIILVSSTRECLRSATIDNLVDVGYLGWTSLILRFGSLSLFSLVYVIIQENDESCIFNCRGADDESNSIQKYKSEVRKQLMSSGYRIWGVLGDQWSSIEGLPAAKRTFKLPNPLYYVA